VGKGVFEVYPAGSLAAWGLTPAQSYKQATAESRAVRGALLGELRRRLPWLEVAAADAYAADADALDALHAVPSARAAAQGLSGRPPGPGAGGPGAPRRVDPQDGAVADAVARGPPSAVGQPAAAGRRTGQGPRESAGHGDRESASEGGGGEKKMLLTTK